MVVSAHLAICRRLAHLVKKHAGDGFVQLHRYVEIARGRIKPSSRTLENARR